MSAHLTSRTSLPTRLAARAALLSAALLLAACSGGDDRSVVERLGASGRQGPEEFATLPQKPLELPADLSALPLPQPGTGSRADLTPREDARTALSGGARGGSSVAADRSLLLALGVDRRDPDIRATLRAEDVAYRRNNRGKLLNRLFNKDTEKDVYSDFILDAGAELIRLRALGVAVPQLPPERR